MRQAAERLSIPPENCICTGDIVAYCAQAKASVDFIRDWGIHCLMGNCEESFARSAEDCGCGFEAGTSCDLLSAQWFQFANRQLETVHREWFVSLPRTIQFDFNGISALVVHGSVSSINQFIFSSTNEVIFRNEFSLSHAALILSGHCGLPFTKVIDKKIWHNSGAIGMPANDGTTRTWFSVLSTADKKLRIDTFPLVYKHEKAFTEMKKVGMNNGYAEALLSGLWPSMDVLPVTEKQQRGKALKEQTLAH
jgi:predicted phosphodiesterase